MSKEVDDLVSAVQGQETVIDGAVVFLNGLGPLMQDVAGDKQKTLNLAQEVIAKTKSLSDALVAGTAAQGETPVNPVP